MIDYSDAETLKLPRNVAMLPTMKLKQHRLDAWDGLVVLAPLALLALEILAVVRIGLIRFPGTGTDSQGDYYRYVSMALPHSPAGLARDNPFIYRILVPTLVKWLSQVGLPVLTSFFILMCLSLALSIIGTYILVRGFKQDRWVAALAAGSFTTLLWAVAFNVREYPLIDPAAQAFMVWILVACQQRRYLLAALLGTLGILCKETNFLPIAFTATQLLLSYWAPLSARVGELVHGRIGAVVGRIPGVMWLKFLALVSGPLLATWLLHIFLHPVNQLSSLLVWQHYISERFRYGILNGVWNSVRLSTWGTYGVLFFWAMAALVLGSWRQAKWSGWAWLSAALVLLYSYTVSSDNQRMSINGWPFVLLLAALGIDAVSKRLHISPVLLWVATLAVQIVYEPPTATYATPTYDKPFSVMYGKYTVISMNYGVWLMALMSVVVGVMVALILVRQRSQIQRAE